MSEPYPEVDPALSRDATHSSWGADPDAPEQNPPAGPQVVQQLGYPVTYEAVVSAIDPTSSPVGPPEDVLLTVTGSGFAPNAKIAFGKDEAGAWVVERSDRPAEDTLTTVITAGLFPNPDPAVPVAVVNAPGVVSNEMTFAFTTARRKAS
jgi:hypothetical protein